MTTTLLIAAFALVAVWLWLRRFPLAALQLLLCAVRRLFGYQRRQVTIDGLRWTYIDSGDDHSEAARPVMLLVHGFAADKDMWLGYAALLKDRYRIIAPDLPGFGETGPCAEEGADYSPRTQAARLAQFCDAVGIDQAHVCSSSMGGFISCWFAIDFPSRTLTLTLMNAAGVTGYHESPVQLAVESGRNPLIATNREELDAVLKLLAVRQPFLPRFVREALLEVYRERIGLWDNIFWQLVEMQLIGELERSLGMISAPTLIIWGAQDQIIDASCAEIFDTLIANSKVVMFDGVGHVPMFEVAKPAAKAQREWLSDREGSQPASRPAQG